ncbi:MAG TPA: carbamoyltransferase HypF, partial [Solirubrobacteraceae bacterium]|nr:carbamoyltransferase HypF [Solirubrobacteraceae bacterium]
PFVYRLAHEEGLGGWVRNDRGGVELEVEGEASAVERFFERLGGEAPVLASIAEIRREPLAGGEGGEGGDGEFRILASAGRTAGRVSPSPTEAPLPLSPASIDAPLPPTAVSPDIGPCEACLRELFDAGDRRHRYPFINCTDCGPRFTILRRSPYDRGNTTMAKFRMCEACREEYEDPASRRFHAQPNGCGECGPQLRLIDPRGDVLARGDEALRGVVEALAEERIVAVKGVGGYHLACRADSEGAVGRLREGKRRAEKPFALMSRDLRGALELVKLRAAEGGALCSRERPIVIARRRMNAPVASSVAAGCRDLGVMLPSTPLHYLLLGDLAEAGHGPGTEGVPERERGAALVMTSGNVSEEPMVHRDEEAVERLGGIAELVLGHDRGIEVRADDSIVRAVDPAASERPLPIRRSRGYAPGAIELPIVSPPLLACGAQSASTFCVARGRRAWPGQHVGELGNWETLKAFREGIEHFEELFEVRPEMVARDLHPDYLSSAYAVERAEREGLECVAVQHHHAHFAACLAEHGVTGPAVGAIYDGAGLGEDGTIWGGELLAGDLGGVERAGSLFPVRLPGGEAAVREPWRMACAWMVAAFTSTAAPTPPPPAAIAGGVEGGRWEQVGELARTGTASPVTTSVGRLFDAVAAMCGIRLAVREEGRAAMELEDAAALEEKDAYPLAIREDERLVLDARETIRAILDDLDRGTPVGVVSGRFHNALADGTARALGELA